MNYIISKLRIIFKLNFFLYLLLFYAAFNSCTLALLEKSSVNSNKKIEQQKDSNQKQNCATPTIQDLESKLIRKKYKIESEEEKLKKMLCMTSKYNMPNAFSDPSNPQNIPLVSKHLENQELPANPDELLVIEVYEKSTETFKAGDSYYARLKNTKNPYYPEQVLAEIEIVKITEITPENNLYVQNPQQIQNQYYEYPSEYYENLYVNFSEKPLRIELKIKRLIFTKQDQLK